MMTFWKMAYPNASKDWGGTGSYMAQVNGAIKGYGATNCGNIQPVTTLEEIYSKILTLGASAYNAPVYAYSDRPTINKNTHEQYIDTRVQTTNHLVIDVDSLHLEVENPYDLVEIGKKYSEHLHKVVPEFFDEDMSFVIVASGSMWKDISKLKFHIHFLLEQPTTILHMKQLISSYPEVAGDPAIYSAARLLLCAPPKNSNLPSHLMDMNNRVRIYTGKNILVKNVHNLMPCMPSKANADFRGYAAELNKAAHGILEPQTLLEVLPFLQYQDRKRLKARLASLNPLHPKARQDGAINVVRSIICTLGRASRVVSPTTVEHLLEDNITTYISSNSKQKSVRSYIENGLSTQYSYTDMLMRKDLKNMNKISYTEIPPNEQGKLDLPEWFGSQADTTYFLKGSLGVGKTTNIKRKILSGELQTPVLYIIPLRGIVADVTASMNLTDYRSSDFNGFKTVTDAEHFSKTWDSEVKFGDSIVKQKTNGICTVVNSLTKPGLDALIHTQFFKTIIIDEADAVLRNIVTLVQKSNHSAIVSALLNLREKAKHTIIMDGDLSASTVTLYNEIFDNAWYSEVVTCETPGLKDVPAYSFMSEASIIGTALKLAQEGKKILIVSDKGPQWVETVALAFREVAPLCNTEVYHSKAAEIKGSVCHLVSNPPSSIKEEMALNNVTCSMSQYIITKHQVDILVASPSMVSAQDFVGYFDAVVSINSEAYGMNLRLQAIARERKPKVILYYIDVDNLSTISYFKQFKPFADVLEGNSSNITQTTDLSDNYSRYIRSIRTQYNPHCVLDQTLMHMDCRKVMEQYNYNQLMRHQLISKGVKLYEVLLGSPNCVEAEKLYSSVFTEDLCSVYSTYQRAAVVSNTPNKYATQEFINNTIQKISDYFGEDVELTDSLVDEYLNFRPDNKGEQLGKLQQCGDLLDTILELLGDKNTNWYGKKERLIELLIPKQRDLSMEKVHINHSNIERFIYSLGIPTPSWSEQKEYMSIIPPNYDYKRLIKHAQSCATDELNVPNPVAVEYYGEPMMEEIL